MTNWAESKPVSMRQSSKLLWQCWLGKTQPFQLSVHEAFHHDIWNTTLLQYRVPSIKPLGILWSTLALMYWLLKDGKMLSCVWNGFQSLSHLSICPYSRVLTFFQCDTKGISLLVQVGCPSPMNLKQKFFGDLVGYIRVEKKTTLESFCQTLGIKVERFWSDYPDWLGQRIFAYQSFIGIVLHLELPSLDALFKATKDVVLQNIIDLVCWTGI